MYGISYVYVYIYIYMNSVLYFYTEYISKNPYAEHIRILNNGSSSHKKQAETDYSTNLTSSLPLVLLEQSPECSTRCLYGLDLTRRDGYQSAETAAWTCTGIKNANLQEKLAFEYPWQHECRKSNVLCLCYSLYHI